MLPLKRFLPRSSPKLYVRRMHHSSLQTWLKISGDSARRLYRLPFFPRFHQCVFPIPPTVVSSTLIKSAFTATKPKKNQRRCKRSSFRLFPIDFCPFLSGFLYTRPFPIPSRRVSRKDRTDQWNIPFPFYFNRFLSGLVRPRAFHPFDRRVQPFHFSFRRRK